MATAVVCWMVVVCRGNEIAGPVAVTFSRSGRLLMSMMCWPS